MSKIAVEVITSVQRRRRWSAAEKERLVAVSLEPGNGISAVAREAGIHPSQLFGWRRQLCRPAQRPVGFAPVQVRPEPLRAGVSAPGTIEIEFANGSRMRVSGSLVAAALAAVVQHAGQCETAAMIAIPSGGSRFGWPTGHTEMRKASMALHAR